jgi:hypothetical protein
MNIQYSPHFRTWSTCVVAFVATIASVGGCYFMLPKIKKCITDEGSRVIDDIIKSDCIKNRIVNISNDVEIHAASRHFMLSILNDAALKNKLTEIFRELLSNELFQRQLVSFISAILQNQETKNSIAGLITDITSRENVKNELSISLNNVIDRNDTREKLLVLLTGIMSSQDMKTTIHQLLDNACSDPSVVNKIKEAINEILSSDDTKDSMYVLVKSMLMNYITGK